MSRASTLVRLPVGLSGDASGNLTSAGTINGLTVGKGAGSVATNTAVGASALASNSSGAGNTVVGDNAGNALTGSRNTLIGLQAGKNSTADNNTFVGAAVGYANTTGTNNVGVGGDSASTYTTLRFNTTGSNNTAIGMSALAYNSTASNNTAVGFQAGYTKTTGDDNTFIGRYAGYSSTTNISSTFVGKNAGYGVTTGNANTFVGSNAAGEGAGQYVTTGAKNTIIGGYNGNAGGIDIRTDSNNIVISDGDGNPRLYYDYVSSSIGVFTVLSNTTANSTNATFRVQNATGADLLMEAGNYSPVGISSIMRIAKITSNGRTISAAGTVNQNGADYAEYMVKSGDFTVAKGDVVGINTEGKITNVFADAISFCVKSTDPGLVGGDSWFTEPRPQDENGNELLSDTTEYAEWFARMEAARATVDRIAFCGQVPVNVTGAAAGQYIIPVDDNGAIKGEAVSNPTFEQYQQAVGKVIAVEQDGRARIIVKVV